MISNKNSNQLIFRDGTSQKDRLSDALRPDYVQVEERGFEDLIKEAQRLATEIRFFNQDNQPSTNWEGLLVDDFETYYKETRANQDIIRNKWAKQLTEYVEYPKRFKDNASLHNKLSRPQVVLFMTFLKLLDHVKTQINGLTKKHLDFYFREKLGLTPKGAVPDLVHVLLELTEDIDQLEVEAGTLLYAGKDESGNELHYKTDHDTVISQAKIEQIKTVFVAKSTSSIQDSHLNNVDRPDKGFAKMMEMALGVPAPSDPLPALPEGVTDLVALLNELNTDTKKQNYIKQQLFLSLDDFRFIIQTHLNDLDSKKYVAEADWNKVYQILDRAYKNKIIAKRKAELKELHDAEGFDALIKYVYGTPSPGDQLPPYRGTEVSLRQIYDDLNSNDEGLDSLKQEARNYIQRELFLTTSDFQSLIVTNEKTNATAAEWQQVYDLLELADRKVRSFVLPTPEKEELQNIYAEPDAQSATFTLSGGKEESLRFKTFGGYQTNDQAQLKPASMGFAISSPILSLKEGRREITATIALNPVNLDHEMISKLINNTDESLNPFQVLLSTKNEWIKPDVNFSFGDNFVADPIEIYSATIKGNNVSATSGANFDETDLGRYLVWSDGSIYKINLIEGVNTVQVQKVGKTEARASIQKYDKDAVYLSALKIFIRLSEDDSPVEPLVSDEDELQINAEFPVLAFKLNNILTNKKYISHYEKLMNLKVQKTHLHVDVQGIRNVILQNDESALDPKKPFEPFGFEPEPGCSFYLANEEMASKRLNDLSLELEWMKSTNDYLINHFPKGDDNASGEFTAKAYLHDKRVELALESIKLIPDESAYVIAKIPEKISETSPFKYKAWPEVESEEEEVLEWDRYFRLELTHPDFQGTLFSQPEGPEANIYPAFTPKIKTLRVGYSSHTELLENDNLNTFYHIHPFGCEAVNTAGGSNLIPAYNDEGYLYLGIGRLIKPQILSVLFQMAEGSANPDFGGAQIQWSYLKANQWQFISDGDILLDTTNGLLNTGVVQVKVPADATDHNTIMPEGLHWIRLSCNKNTVGISDAIAILAQAVNATFITEQVEANHFVELLAAGSITQTLLPNPNIRQIQQPFTSSKGKPAEKDSMFYTRISERLRHKNRAINMWDYERIVLDKFPEVYKVKCLPEAYEAYEVTVMVVPDIRGKLPFDPFQPKVPADTLQRIQTHLDHVAPAFANISVKNPSYLQIKTRCVVKFKAGYNEGFYKGLLIEEIKQFLSPWAYRKGNDITIGGAIYSSVIVNHIAEQPYIEYVANMKLFQSEDGKRFTDVRTINNGENKAVASKPDMVLVSATSHEIDVVDENGYDQEIFEGINYMKVELDFQVGKDLL
ncbi:baseplate J/gp47 family protein [Fulvivirga sediminis]|uniref:Baseplate J/gp47 family protein n=1 Tax=Fulvivirga sediminis TaxID=2803949 RepID=A0A937F4E6_9BACT|nr:baseplate J/gp47 family protein [Fulvivirga sediminis]MBL3655535.1 baseplate J/gp47 family protein [Fulvivirga sediminis]